jgi:hypothetical protein
MKIPARHRPRPAQAALFLALAFAAGGSQAHEFNCDVESDYSISLERGSLRFEREDGTPARVELRRGRLLIDGEPARLSDADAARIARMLRELQALAPEVLAIALEALDIAFDALSEVANGLLDDSDATRARLAEAHERIEAELRAAPIGSLDDRRLENVVEQTVAELVPTLVAEVVKAALSAAFTGDTAAAQRLEARAERLEREIEARIEPRAEALAARARVVCEQIVELDALEGELEYRLPDGSRLELLRSGPH